MNIQKSPLNQRALKRLGNQFSLETLARFQEIVQELQAHQKNIAYLAWVGRQKKVVTEKGSQRYESKPEDRARLPKTLLNLRQQMDLLAYEWEVLKRYGR